MVHQRGGWLYTDRQALKEGGCFTVDAGIIHAAIRDLILAERGSEGWDAAMCEMFDRAGEAQEHMSQRVRLAENRLRRVEKALDNKLYAQAACGDDERDFYLDEVRKWRQEKEGANHALREARAQQRSASESWTEIAEILSETRGIAEAFVQRRWELCRKILHWWVDRSVPIPSMRRSAVETTG